MDKTKAVTILAINYANYSLSEVGDIVSAEQIAQHKSEPDTAHSHSNDEDTGPIADGLFTDVWNMKPP